MNLFCFKFSTSLISSSQTLLTSTHCFWSFFSLNFLSFFVTLKVNFLVIAQCYEGRIQQAVQNWDLAEY